MGVKIQIVAGPDQNSSSVQASGSIQHIITDQERQTFHITDGDLKNAVGKYFGKNPNDAYLHSETPWGDLYRTYGWEQTSLVLVVQKAEILSITSEPSIVATQTFTNQSTKVGTFNCSISQQVSNSTQSNWSTGGTLTIGQEFEYGVEFLGVGGKGKTSISYSQSWGIGGSHSSEVTVGSDSGLSVQLNPGESVTAQLIASRGVMKVRVTYMAYLRGNAAVNYNPTFKDHHFWCLPISGVLSAAGLSNSLMTTEDIEIGFYSDARIELKDASGALRKSLSMMTQPAGPISIPQVTEVLA